MATLFDALESETRKQDGMSLAAANRRELLERARALAVRIALSRESRECTADDVQEALHAAGESVHALGNAAGSLFAGRAWEWTGRFVKSRRIHAHSNLIRSWKYIGPDPVTHLTGE